jgi:hypothetical protein
VALLPAGVLGVLGLALSLLFAGDLTAAERRVAAAERYAWPARDPGPPVPPAEGRPAVLVAKREAARALAAAARDERVQTSPAAEPPAGPGNRQLEARWLQLLRNRLEQVGRLKADLAAAKARAEDLKARMPGRWLDWCGGGLLLAGLTCGAVAAVLHARRLPGAELAFVALSAGFVGGLLLSSCFFMRLDLRERYAAAARLEAELRAAVAELGRDFPETVGRLPPTAEPAPAESPPSPEQALLSQCVRLLGEFAPATAWSATRKP